MRRILALTIPIVSLVLASVHTGSAFQTKPVPVAGEEAASSAAPVEAGKTMKPGDAAELAGGEKNAEDSGINIWIPGLGIVGKLPKVNFGLELLYGDKEQDLQSETSPDLLDEELTIKGTLKHKF